MNFSSNLIDQILRPITYRFQRKLEFHNVNYYDTKIVPQTEMSFTDTSVVHVELS